MVYNIISAARSRLEADTPSLFRCALCDYCEVQFVERNVHVGLRVESTTVVEIFEKRVS